MRRLRKLDLTAYCGRAGYAQALSVFSGLKKGKISMDRNEAQLELIKELFAECESRNLRIWLLGGWGIDALLGRVSREHYDIDVAAEASSKEALRAAIEHIGGEFADKPMGWRFCKNDVRVDITFVSYLADGTPVSDLKKDDPTVYPWPPSSFPDECNGRLPGLSCRAISWEAQYVAKAGYKDAFPDTTLRAKDDSDLEIIRRHVPTEKRKELEEKWFGGIPREAVGMMKMIDSHIHLIEEDPDEYLELLVRRMDEHGITGAVLFTHQIEGALADSAVREATEKYPGRFIPFLSKTVDISRDDSLARCLDELRTGFWKGVGELFLDCTNDETVRFTDRYGAEHILTKPVPPDREDDSLYSGIFRFCGQAGLPVMIHCMDALVMERTLAKFPKTRFIWAHADHGFYDSIPMDLIQRYSNLYCDFGVEFRFQYANLFSDQPESWLIEHVERWREMCRRFPTRVVWGTDLFVWDDLAPENFVMGIRAWHKIAEELAEDQQKAVAGGNILRLTGHGVQVP